MENDLKVKGQGNSERGQWEWRPYVSPHPFLPLIWCPRAADGTWHTAPPPLEQVTLGKTVTFSCIPALGGSQQPPSEAPMSRPREEPRPKSAGSSLSPSALQRSQFSNPRNQKGVPRLEDQGWGFPVLGHESNAVEAVC